MSDAEKHSRYSSLREKIVEHVFIGELLMMLWQRSCVDVEIARSEVDNTGAVVRHVQLKSSIRGGRSVAAAGLSARNPGPTADAIRPSAAA